MKSALRWLKSLSLKGKVVLGIGTLIVLGMVGGQNNAANTSSASLDQSTQNSSQINSPAPVVTTKFISETQVVPFTSSTIEDATLAKGTTKITTTGVNGSETLDYEVTYKDGKQTDKKLIGSVVDVQPINQITSVGTYVAPVVTTPSCSNGSYINSYGNTVCSPSYTPSTTTSATAICRDGTYSYSQHRSGTCSHHGGVAHWL